MLSPYEIELLKQLSASYPNYYDTDALDLSDDKRSAYIQSMLKLGNLGYVESGLIETATSHVISNPKITLKGMEYLRRQ